MWFDVHHLLVTSRESYVLSMLFRYFLDVFTLSNLNVLSYSEFVVPLINSSDHFLSFYIGYSLTNGR
ncbi:hypothetical protein DU484_18160 [Haloplanus rubicundus]|uniref:Uncharacterized protein n=1 Tax=Haloplanus rubicundus TaxID=1547898 RepID=A0A345EHF2_9EURY|nr:hypothetical protein DU484_18160 [Haloplanus rubicundus]